MRTSVTTMPPFFVNICVVSGAKNLNLLYVRRNIKCSILQLDVSLSLNLLSGDYRIYSLQKWRHKTLQYFFLSLVLMYLVIQ